MVEPFLAFYKDFANADLSKITELYRDDATFKDPVVSLSGATQIREYFESTRKNIKSCEFHFSSIIEQDQSACMTWEMDFAHPQLRGGDIIKVSGASVLNFDGNLCCEHADYYDMGALLYEHIPILKTAVGWIKSKM